MSQGKGSRPRPASVDADTYAERWARTFQRDRESGEAIRERLGAQRVTIADDPVGVWQALDQLRAFANRKRDDA